MTHSFYVMSGKLTWSSIRAAVVIRSADDQGKLTDDEIWVRVRVAIAVQHFHASIRYRLN